MNNEAKNDAMRESRLANKILAGLIQETLARMRGDILRFEICAAALDALRQPIPVFDTPKCKSELPPRRQGPVHTSTATAHGGSNDDRA